MYYIGLDILFFYVYQVSILCVKFECIFILNINKKIDFCVIIRRQVMFLFFKKIFGLIKFSIYFSYVICFVIRINYNYQFLFMYMNEDI